MIFNLHKHKSIEEEWFALSKIGGKEGEKLALMYPVRATTLTDMFLSGKDADWIDSFCYAMYTKQYEIGQAWDMYKTCEGGFFND